MFNSSYQKLGEHLLERYLRMLGVKKRQPSINSLAELVAAHLTLVPFENISKLYYRKHLALNTIREDLFGIPQGIVKDVMGELRNLNDAWN